MQTELNSKITNEQKNDQASFDFFKAFIKSNKAGEKITGSDNQRQKTYLCDITELSSPF